MSLASVRSNRGDSYELLIAAKWTVRMLMGVDIESINVDSTELDSSHSFIEVDDVVVTRADGSKVYCQCKKNQPDFDSWKVPDLKDDLEKAARQLRRDPRGTVVFYSTAPFGQIQKLREHSMAFTDADAFKRSLETNKSLRQVADALETVWSGQLDQGDNNSFSLLRRISFEATSSQASLAEDIIRDLAIVCTQASIVFDALIAYLFRCKSRTTGETAEAHSVQALTREAALQLVAKTGSRRTPPRAEAEIADEFRRMSAVGRAWRREIGSRRIPRRSLEAILEHVENGEKRVLVADAPGAGKTCLLLDLVEELERRSVCAVAYIQAREYTEAVDDASRAALGLLPQLLDSVARMSEYRPVVLVIDSMDVLSLAREHASVKYFLALLDQLSTLPNITAIVACRTFDLKYDRKLANREWGKTVTPGPLDWQQHVMPLLKEWGVAAADLNESLQKILTNPRMLAIFGDLASAGRVSRASNAQELTEDYIEAIVTENAGLGEGALRLLEQMAGQMLLRRRLSIPDAAANMPQQIKAALLSSGIIAQNSSRGIEFAHQTLLDVFAVRGASRAGTSLIQFIRSHAATPFLRPTIRSFLFHLRISDPTSFRSQIRAVVEAADIAFHIKRLVVESFAEVTPTDEDWRLVRHLSSNHAELFQLFYFATQATEWFDFFTRFWWPYLVSSKDVTSILLFIHHLDCWATTRSAAISRIFLDLLAFDWIPGQQATSIISTVMHRWTDWESTDLQPILTALLESSHARTFQLGEYLAHWVSATNSGDDLLWRFITKDVKADDTYTGRIGAKLLCAPDRLGRDKDFLATRMKGSTRLLDLAVDTIDDWTRRQLTSNGNASVTRGFLFETSYSDVHTRYSMRHVDASMYLMRAVEAACLMHAGAHTEWWQRNVEKLLRSSDGGLRYIVILAFINNPESNVVHITNALCDTEILAFAGDFEIGRLLNAAYHLLDEQAQDRISTAIIGLLDDQTPDAHGEATWIRAKRRALLAWIPACLRSGTIADYLRDLNKEFGEFYREPRIERSGGYVPPPFQYQRFLELPHDQVVRLLRRYSGKNYADDFLHVGGPSSVATQLADAACRYPMRFLALLQTCWPWIDDVFGAAILSGVSRHIEFRVGTLRASENWEALESPVLHDVARLALDELDRHPASWYGTTAAAEVLKAVAHAIENGGDFARLSFHIVGVSRSQYPETEEGETAFIALNSTRGQAGEASVIAVLRCIERGREVPDLLIATLSRLAADKNPGVRYSVLRHLPNLQQADPNLAWDLFATATQLGDSTIWKEAESYLYYTYHVSFDRVAPYLQRLHDAGIFESWSHIACLASLSGHVAEIELKNQLSRIENEGAWIGAARVFATNAGLSEYRLFCCNMLEWILQNAPSSHGIVQEIDIQLFSSESTIREIPEALLRSMFNFLSRADPSVSITLTSFLSWLARNAVEAPDATLIAIESMLELTTWSEEGILFFEPSTLGALFAEAEEREESDHGNFLQRVVSVQDAMLRRGGNSLYGWLKDAERP